VPWEQKDHTRDDFNDDQLNIHFQTLRTPLQADTLTLAERPGYLRLYGRESLTSQFTQAFVARRWQNFHFEAETKVDFKPITFQQMAGLVCYYNTLNWTSLHVTWHEEKGRIIDLMTAENAHFDQPISNNEIIVPDQVESVYLKVKVAKDIYTYHYSFDGKAWHNIPVTLDSYKLSDDFVSGGGFFTGAFVGMHCHDASGTRLHADFDYFKYEALD